MEPTIVQYPLGDNPPTARLYYGVDVLTGLRELLTGSVHCVCTSPPYFGLRDYNTPPLVWGGNPKCEHVWGVELPPHHPGQVKQSLQTQLGLAKIPADPTRVGKCLLCGAWLGQLGLEPTPQLYVQHLVEIFREVKRVLRPDGTLWINLGDSYARDAGKGQHKPGETGYKQAYIYDQGHGRASATADLDALGLRAKNLIGIPWRVAFGLQEDGWILRNDIIWEKPNVLPESVADRCTKSHEYVFLFSQRERYFYDATAIVEPVDVPGGRPCGPKNDASRNDFDSTGTIRGNGTTRNKRTVWTIPTHPYAGAHFAVFPPALVEPMVLAGTSEKGCCRLCGAPRRRILVPGDETRPDKTVGWEASCVCGTGNKPCTVLDPFSGSATTGSVALANGRDYVGIDLSTEYLQLAVKRLTGSPLPSEPTTSIFDLFGGANNDA